MKKSLISTLILFIIIFIIYSFIPKDKTIGDLTICLKGTTCSGGTHEAKLLYCGGSPTGDSCKITLPSNCCTVKNVDLPNGTCLYWMIDNSPNCVSAQFNFDPPQQINIYCENCSF